MVDNTVSQLGNYRLIGLLGQGGFADVYLGKHIYLKTKAAIKVLQSRLAPTDLESFLQEAQTISGLIHPHIVRVLEFGVEDNIPFLVMDYAPNGTLRKRYPRGTQLPLTIIVSYVNQVSTALQYAHSKKIIHRDIKPENMLLGNNDEILLSDFGIALLSQSSRSQSTREMAGTVSYMAPEQLRGKPRSTSDQYALGIVTYEWLCGERPFNGTFIEIASQHMLVPPTPLHERIPSISPAIEDVVMTALSKNPQQRFESVQAFAQAFEQAVYTEQANTFISSTSNHMEVRERETNTSIKHLYSDPLDEVKVPLSPSHTSSTSNNKARSKRNRVPRRRMLIELGIGAIAVGSTALAAYEMSQKPSSGSEMSTNQQLQEEYNRGLSDGKNHVINNLQMLEGVSPSAAITSAELTRVAYDVYVSPLVTLAATVAGDYLNITFRALINGRSSLSSIGQDNATLAALQTVLETWIKQANAMPKQIVSITNNDLDHAQVYLQALQKDLKTEQTLLNSPTATPTARPKVTPTQKK